MNNSEYFTVDIEIDKALSKMGIASDDISAKAREKIREDAGGMIGARLDFSDQDQISELEKAISNWIKKFPK